MLIKKENLLKLLKLISIRFLTGTCFLVLFLVVSGILISFLVKMVGIGVRSTLKLTYGFGRLAYLIGKLSRSAVTVIVKNSPLGTIVMILILLNLNLVFCVEFEEPTLDKLIKPFSGKTAKKFTDATDFSTWLIFKDMFEAVVKEVSKKAGPFPNTNFYFKNVVELQTMFPNSRTRFIPHQPD